MKIHRSGVLVLSGLGIAAAFGGALLFRSLTARNSEGSTSLNSFMGGFSSKASTNEKPAVPPPKPPPATSPDGLARQIEKALSSKDITDWEWVLNILFPALAAKDRAAAARLVAGLPPGDVHEQLLRRLARIWATTDFADAVTWIATLPGAEDRKAAFEDACFQVADTDPGEAINAWERLEFTADDHVLENLVQSWASKDLPATQAWLATKEPSKFRDQAVARVVYVMAKDKPAEAIAFATAQIPVGPAQTEAVISALNQWAQSDLNGATAWVQRLPNGEIADRARAELAGLQGK